MNFNIGQNHDNEYDLFKSTSEEVINLYGIPVKYLITEKVNQDIIYGEYNSIKVNSDDTYEFYAMPENTSEFDGDNSLFSRFGLASMNNITLFVSRTTMEIIHPELANKEGSATIENLPNGNLIIFDSNKIMEVTDFKLTGEFSGNNNVFTSNLNKNVYKLVLKDYSANHDDYSNTQGIQDEYNDFGNLEKIFGDPENDEELGNDTIIKDIIEKEATEVIPADEVIRPNTTRVKPIRDKEAESNPFGYLG